MLVGLALESPMSKQISYYTFLNPAMPCLLRSTKINQISVLAVEMDHVPIWQWK